MLKPTIESGYCNMAVTSGSYTTVGVDTTVHEGANVPTGPHIYQKRSAFLALIT